MSADVTEQQSDDDKQRSRDLSLRSTQPPTQAPGYEAQRLLGTGAYGEVWVGLDQNTGRRVAIKFYAHRRSVDWSLLSREVEKLVFLSADRYVVQLLDVGWDADPPYYVMEYIENGSLDEMLRREGTLGITDAVDLWKEICTGLAHAHGKGVLHCDLKPANILLDADNRPRLADFGQSRLSHEQRPALGTLFYMAPEQADLQAVPDVRWDVYAMGAILYCLLVGLPPHRNDDSVSHIDTAGDLADRLARYRRLITTAPLPTEHRRVTGMDRALAEIIDRCLAPHPQDRFANIQEVLDALTAREKSRSRRPMLVLGFAGPLILLSAMTLFGFRGYEQALRDTEEMARSRAVDNNDFAAQLAAEKVTVKIANYFDICRQEANREELHAHLAPVLQQSMWLPKLNNPQVTDADLNEARPKFLNEKVRSDLNEYLDKRFRAYQAAAEKDARAPKFASMFVTDAFGTQLAVVFDEDAVSRSIGKNVAHRSYFSGDAVELPEFPRASPNAKHIEQTNLSSVFQSSSTQRWKVAVSTPLLDNDKKFIGVLVLTVNLSDLELVASQKQAGEEKIVEVDHFPVLIDGRKGESAGTVLHHPLYDLLRHDKVRLPADVFARRVPGEIMRGEAVPGTERGTYHDPLGDHPLGKEKGFDRPWIGVAAPVKLPDASQAESGLIVLMQEDYRFVIGPVQQLGNRLLREALIALASIVVLSIGLWWFVIRQFREQRPSIRSSSSGSTQSTPLQDVQTLAQTLRNRRK
ncbi:Serine/threonine-protein kinase PrkC [Anatilimnocola aggregata]|uniref:Serine/threonine-protein kinase PrkC n=1 Tax=Anatilimnocola aggregata TaxID=2528021 RepID=A0A517YCA7_9BACT|nr:serine/threonine protein kinase [Anatilimnocola aggregata]QDU27877.1 Serine/threonine-protein kinase PrkC [Anatilimnocola aggregata]